MPECNGPCLEREGTKVGQLMLLMKVQVSEGTVGEGDEKQRAWNGGGKGERGAVGARLADVLDAGGVGFALR